MFHTEPLGVPRRIGCVNKKRKMVHGGQQRRISGGFLRKAPQKTQTIHKWSTNFVGFNRAGFSRQFGREGQREPNRLESWGDSTFATENRSAPYFFRRSRISSRRLSDFVGAGGAAASARFILLMTFTNANTQAATIRNSMVVLMKAP